MTAAARWPARREPANNQFFSPDGNGTYLVFYPIVIDRQLPIIEKARQCAPAPEAVIQFFGSRRAIRDLLALQLHPLMHGIGHVLQPINI